MILLSAQNLVKHYGPDPVLAGCSFEIRPGDKIGLVGPNGAGKTTLMRILCKNLDPDGGSFDQHSSVRIGYLEQHPTFAENRTVWEEAKLALADLLALSHEAELVAQQIGSLEDETERLRLGKRFDQLQHELHRRDAYHLDHKIERVLHGLGFTPASFHQQVNSLSGGQKNRLVLAQLLLAEPDLMLLDEPSNHLDIEATEWLEDFLQASNAAVLVVSHDRYFLDRVTNRTFELFQGTIEDYVGNFSAYWRQKAERVEVQRRTYEKQQIEIEKMEDFIRRNFYGQKATQAEDRRKKLERIERVLPPREINGPPMGFPPASRTGDIVLRVEHLAKGFDRPLFNDLSFDIYRGQRWGILGPNGTGKTTLLRCIVGQLKPNEGRVSLGSGVSVGYFDQLLDCVDNNTSVMDAIRPAHKEFFEKQRRDMLARFGLTGDLAAQLVSSLSGGERNRAALARLSASDANFLILDEPTNHLDLWARDSLERAIREFDGTVLLVSHDRYFLNRVVDHILYVETNRFRVIEGNYDTYTHLQKVGLAGAAFEASKQEANKAATKKDVAKSNEASSASGGAKRKRKYPYRKVADLEAEIFERESSVESLHQELTLPEVLRDGRRVKEVQQKIDEQQSTLVKLYEHWEESTELNAEG